MKPKFKIFLIFLVSILIFIGMFYCTQVFLKSQAMNQFIWNVNTFHGMFAHLPDNLPKEHIIGSYAFAFKDYYAHLPRSVSQNATPYAVLLSLLCSAYLPFLFLKRTNSGGNFKRVENSATLLIIVLLGLAARLFFAYHTTCNHDIVSWYIDRDILKQGRNVFAQTARYNYSPFWFWVLELLAQVNRLLPQFSFMFILRIFLTLVDTVTLVVVVRLAQIIHFSPRKAAALFFLNPIGVIITGYHGQFDNIPVLFLLLAIMVYLRYGTRLFYLSWFLLTTGLIAKHEIVQQLLIFFRESTRSKIKALFWFSLSVVLFLLFFAPYWKEGSQGILANVFQYGGISRPYGFMLLEVVPIVAQWHKYFFIALLVIWPFCYKTSYILRSSLAGMLLFLVFASGISAQQFVLPIALAALQPSFGFYLFTTVTSLFLLGNIDELKIPCFQFVEWNHIWIAVSIWFVLELKNSNSLSHVN